MSAKVPVEPRAATTSIVRSVRNRFLTSSATPVSIRSLLDAAFRIWFSGMSGR